MLGSLRVLRVAGSADERLAQLLSAQHGCVSRRQLLTAGLTRDQIQTRVKRRQIEPVYRGVYAAAIPDQPLRLEAAALLACGPSVVLGLITAAHLWSLIPAAQRPIDVVTPIGSRGRARTGIRLRQTATLTGKDIRFRHGLPVTSPERTLIDIAALDNFSDRQLETALDEALGQRHTTLTKLANRIAANPRQPGAARLRRLVTARTTSTITKLEAKALFLKLIRRANIPDPQTQARIDDVFTVDAYWPQARFAIEYDSHQWHMLKTNFERDRRKDRALQKLQIEYRRVTWEQMKNDALELIADIAMTIAKRTPAAIPSSP